MAEGDDAADRDMAAAADGEAANAFDIELGREERTSSCVAVPSLKRFCEHALMSTANTRNVLQLMYTADAIQAEALCVYCTQMVACNLPLVLRTELWAHLPPQLLCALRTTLVGDSPPTPTLGCLDDDQASRHMPVEHASCTSHARTRECPSFPACIPSHDPYTTLACLSR